MCGETCEFPTSNLWGSAQVEKRIPDWGPNPSTAFQNPTKPTFLRFLSFSIDQDNAKRHP